MTGLEKIIEKIEQKSAARCEEILAEARALAADIEAKTAAQAEMMLADARAKAALDAEDRLRMAESGAEQKARQIILAARIEAVNETLDAAAEALNAMPAQEYFDALISLAVANAAEGQGQLRLSSRDIARLPADFEQRLNAALAANGASVSVGTEPAPIENGFILIYGDIEINCSFEALLEAYRDELKETVCNIIF